MCSSHSFFFSLLKSRSALLFINCSFTTPLVFPLLLTGLQLLQHRISFYDFWCSMSNNILCGSEGGPAGLIQKKKKHRISRIQSSHFLRRSIHIMNHNFSKLSYVSSEQINISLIILLFYCLLLFLPKESTDYFWFAHWPGWSNIFQTVCYSDYWPLLCPQPLPEATEAGEMRASSETLVPSLNEAVWSPHTPPLTGCWALAGICVHSGYAALVLCNRKKHTQM